MSSSYACRRWLRPIRPTVRWEFVLGGVLLLTVGVLIGVVVTTVGARGTGEFGLDRALGAHRPAGAVGAAWVFTTLASPWLAPLTLLASGALVTRLAGRAAGMWCVVLALVGWLGSTVCKQAFRRHRPPTDAVHALVTQHQPNSFPSGHTAFTTAVVIALAVTLRAHPQARTRVLLVGGPVIVAVGASRLVLGAHYWGDVLGAPFIASGAILLVTGLVEPGIRRRLRSTPA